MTFRAKPAVKKTPRIEGAIQAAWIEGFRLCCGPDVVAFSVPNECPDAWVGFLSKLGMLKGVCDVAVLWPEGQSGWIEFKDPRGPVSPEQRDFHETLRRIGHRVGVARSSEDAWGLIREWEVPVTRRIEDGKATLIERPNHA